MSVAQLDRYMLGLLSIINDTDTPIAKNISNVFKHFRDVHLANMSSFSFSGNMFIHHVFSLYCMCDVLLHPNSYLAAGVIYM